MAMKISPHANHILGNCVSVNHTHRESVAIKRAIYESSETPYADFYRLIL